MEKSREMIDILLVEDSLDDVELTKRAFDCSGFKVNLHHVSNGFEALEYLESECLDYPDIILLDINMPKMNGIELLKKIRCSEVFDYIPVIFLTTSESELDIFNAYKNHGNCYIVKPIDFKKFLEAVEQIKNFWIFLSKIPKKNRKNAFKNSGLVGIDKFNERNQNINS